MKKIILFSVVVFSFFLQSQAQTAPAKTVSKKEAKKWLKKKEWAGGLSLNPHKTIDAQEFYRQYQAHKTYWDEAFAFLKGHDLSTLSTGKHGIDGENVYASVTESRSKDFDSTQWESHRKYIDLQYVIDGKELIGVEPVSKATVIKPYDEKKDVANYTADGKLYAATPGTFFIFFPSDAHRPNITPGGNKVVKKIVIKVRAAE
jgi:YhcH/YjgK/YiaL family protein